MRHTSFLDFLHKYSQLSPVFTLESHDTEAQTTTYRFNKFNGLNMTTLLSKILKRLQMLKMLKSSIKECGKHLGN